MNKILLTIRASLFWVGFFLNALFFGLLSPFLFFIPSPKRLKILIGWARFGVFWVDVTCGLKYQVIDRYKLDRNKTYIVFANHQSTYETMALPLLVPAFSWILKRELLRIPFFGWALYHSSPIAINRSSGKSAIEQIKTIGKEKLDSGLWVCIFPEGTRIAPEKLGNFKLGGGILASHAGYPVIPIAHNSGEFWPKHQFIKNAGMITFSIGPEISTEGKKPAEILQEAKQWIEEEKKTFS
ncbi:MAG: 1-acyl-sn-glycerol-3-phosphate acyltransferase [Thiotrichaceae bacterium]|nr:1-acyl-sn-glycerol-3-phosphate acyltransferase [Thiotrichaceae bacterium]